jgi:hypothetical protein
MSNMHDKCTGLLKQQSLCGDRVQEGTGGALTCYKYK